MGLAVDDITGVGVADNVLIPVVYGVAAFGVFADNVLSKQEEQMQRLALKDRPGNGFTYELLAKQDGYYRNVRNNEMVYMKKGDVWKYGETTQGEHRYSRNSYEQNFKMDPVFYGSKTEILIYEKKMLIEYYYKHHELPPGNKIFK